MPVVVGVLKETAASETRVAVVPEIAAKLTALGAKVLIEGTGAYTTTYSSVGFNGFPPLKSYVI